MTLRRNMEKFIRARKPHIAGDSDIDKRTLDDAFAAMDETVRARSVHGKPGPWKVIIHSRITRLAAAAVIVIAVGFLVLHIVPGPQTRADGAAKSAGEMLTVLSLNIAYSKGGMDALEKQYENAFKILGPRQTGISIHDLLAECNSNWKGQYHEKD